MLLHWTALYECSRLVFQDCSLFFELRVQHERVVLSREGRFAKIAPNGYGSRVGEVVFFIPKRQYSRCILPPAVFYITLFKIYQSYYVAFPSSFLKIKYILHRLFHQKKNLANALFTRFHGGEGGIRTLDTLSTHTRVPDNTYCGLCVFSSFCAILYSKKCS